MNKRKILQLGIALLVCGWLVSGYQSGSQAQRRTTAATAAQRALINDYCVSCHNQKTKTAGIVLEGLDFNRVANNAEVWEKVLRKVSTGQMPPASAPKPEKKEAAALVAWLESTLDHADAVNPQPGRPTIHRLNRAEYSNAVRDLLAVDIQPGQWLPVDDSGHGFDNIGEVLSLSPALLEKYLSAARRVSRLAIGDKTIKPTEDRYLPRRNSRNEKTSDDLPFFSRGGLSFQHYFPLDGEYLIRVRTPSNGETGEPTRFFDHKLTVKAGLRSVGAAYPRQSAKAEPAVPGPRRPGGGAPPAMGAVANQPLDLRLDGARLQRFEIPETTSVEMIIVSGPFNATGRGETASRAKVFSCRPASALASTGEEATCAKQILTKLARRAFRRPVNEADVTPLLAFYERGRQAGEFDDGIQRALEAMLVAPDFLLRVETEPAGNRLNTAFRLNDLDLAARLSFFLWSSIPDEELLSLAEQRKLQDAATLQYQIRRMLDDPRAEALVNNFAGQWLQLRNLETITPDPDVYPGFDESLKLAFRRETELFFESILRENRSVMDLLEADYTYLNQKLAEHYGIRGVYGAQFRRVSLTAEQQTQRSGLLGQGSLLTVTSYPNRTSVVMRGKWILENLLGAAPPPPPPDIPDLKPKSHDGRLLTMREQLDMHRANAVCASCHARMDPLGFALENYDGIGKWRTKDAGQPIDASGKLPNGTKLNGPSELKKVLLTGHRDEFVATVIEKLMTYALGRGLEAHDAPSIRAIARQTEREQFRLPALIASVINSKPFQMRQAEPVKGTKTL